MRIAIRHELRFAIEPGTAHAVQHLLLKPVNTPAQTVIEWEILLPGIEKAAEFRDAFGNIAFCTSQTRPEVETLFVTVNGVVETTDTAGVIGKLPGDPIPALFKRITPQTRPNGSLVNRVRAQERAGAGRLDALHWLMATLHEAERPARETEAAEDTDVPPLEIIAEDHAHVFVAAARGLDLPARFVTGYVVDQEDRPARLHAWAEVYVDETLGWVGFDPSANLCPTDAYVRLAAGLDAESANPIRRVPDFVPDGPEVLTVVVVYPSSQSQGQSQSQGH